MVITAIDPQKNNPERKSVFVDGKYAFSVDEENLFKLDLYVDREITEEEIQSINQVCNISKAKKIALRYIVFKPRTEYEIRVKIKEQGFDEQIIQIVVDQLKEMEYINDRLYAEKYIKDALKLKKIGVKRIYVELQQRGIEREIIEEQINACNPDECEILKPLVQKKLGNISWDECSQPDEISYQAKSAQLNKIRSYFIRKGYSLETINRCLDEIRNSIESE